MIIFVFLILSHSITETGRKNIMPTLSWIGKEKVINHHRDVPFKILEHKYSFSAEKGESEEPVGAYRRILE